MAEETKVYECPQCYAILPYIGCPHHCPVNDNEEEGFCEEQGFLEEFYQQMKNMTITVVEAPDPKILELVPNKEGQEYPGPQILQHGEEQVYHIRQDGEEVPEDVKVTRVYEVSPGQYETVDQIFAEAEEIYGPLPR